MRLLAVVSLAACGACQGGKGEGTAVGDASSVGPDAAPGDLALTCNASDSSYPVFSRRCSDATDCAIANHQIDCCGSTIATGIAATDLTSFEEVEAACGAFFPECGCASQPPILDDGSSAINFDTIDVSCSFEGFCATFNAPQPGG